MKFCVTVIFLTVFAYAASAQKVVKPGDAHRHFGKQVILTGYICGWVNSTKMQATWLYFGSDSAHRQLQVVIQGALYPKLNFDKTGQGALWIGSYRGKTVQIPGIVKGNQDEVYLEATGLPVLKQE